MGVLTTTLAGLILAAVTVLGAPAQATSPLPTTAGPTAERSLVRSHLARARPAASDSSTRDARCRPHALPAAS